MTQHLVPNRHPVRAAIAAIAVISIGILAGCSSSAPPEGGDQGSGEGGSPVHLRVASYIGTGTPAVQASQQWTDLVTEYTAGGITFEWFLSESLLPAAEILGGVGSGTVDMGLTGHGYHPGELPLTQGINAGFGSSNAQAVAAALRDFYESNDAFRAEWDATNVRPILFTALPSLVVGCNFPVAGIDDLKGKNVRAAGLPAEDFAAIGANVVALTAPDMLDAFDRGIIDCWAADLPLANDNGLTQITPYVYDYGRGGNGSQEFMISQTVWDSLSDAQRDAMERATDEVNDEYFKTTLAAAVTAGCDAIKEGGGTMSFLPDAAQAEWKALADPVSVKRFVEMTGGSSDGQKFPNEYTSAVQINETKFDNYVDPNVTCAERFQG